MRLRPDLAALMLLALAGSGCSMPDWFGSDEPTASRMKMPASTGEEPLSRYGNPPSYVALGVRYYVMDSAEGYVEEGLASWYGPKFHGRRTSSGETFDMHQVSAAHKSLPLPTWVKVTRLDTGRTLTVRVNDRGPFKEGRIIDLSYQAAQALGITDEGLVRVEVRAIPRPKTATAPPDRETRFLQLGAFASRANAETMLSELRRQGLPALSVHTRKRDGQILHRVLHGPFDSNTAMHAATARLEDMGITEFTSVIFPNWRPLRKQ